MSSTLTILILAISSIACTLIAGVFQAFSEFVMKALSTSKPAGGIESMQWINRKVFRTGFMVLLVGMAVMAPLILAVTWSALAPPASVWAFSGVAIYLLGTFAVTLFFNVPLNNRLDVMHPDSGAAKLWWPQFVKQWTLWNHIRALAALASGICFLLAAFSI